MTHPALRAAFARARPACVACGERRPAAAFAWPDRPFRVRSSPRCLELTECPSPATPHPMGRMTRHPRTSGAFPPGFPVCKAHPREHAAS